MRRRPGSRRHPDDELFIACVNGQFRRSSGCTVHAMFETLGLHTDEAGQKLLRTQLQELEVTGQLLVNIDEDGDEPRLVYFLH